MTENLKPPVFFIEDEFSYYKTQLMKPNDDILKVRLRKIEGIPNAVYQVINDEVFVFDKLVASLSPLEQELCESFFADTARSLVPSAMVTAAEAVRTWGIVPEPYEVVDLPEHGLIIRHTPFNARLPGAFANMDQVHQVLANVLLGGVQAGEGDFIYRGQPMILLEPLDPSLLPPRPTLKAGLHLISAGRSMLGERSFVLGFEPVDKALFKQLKRLDSSWYSDVVSIAPYVNDRVQQLWAMSSDCRLDTLNDSTDTVPEHDAQKVVDLRMLYPELDMLGGGTLYCQFDNFQRECRCIGRWSAERDDDFLFYLLGKVVDGSYEGLATNVSGRRMAYSLFTGSEADEAISIARDVNRYQTALSSLMHRVRSAIEFVANDKEEPERWKRGREVIVESDPF